MMGWGIVWQHAGLIFKGLVTTIAISSVSVFCAVLLALMLFGVGLRWKLFDRLITAFINGMRCVPFLVLLYFVYYGLPVLHIYLSPIYAGVLALSFYNAAYFSELLRAAWKQIPHEQVEAGLAFGHYGFRLLRRIILKPMIQIALPTFGNQTIQVVKDSAFLVIITVEELTYSANELQATYYIPFASFLCAALLYWAICLVIEAGIRISTRRAEMMR
ncbi:amino acid ABC transporter permease [Acidocella sp.]|uniref:amino acid ABC transporter permease n=1 Tax=Acidocella sp. TaxID=50710 RepID=UPI003D071620